MDELIQEEIKKIQELEPGSEEYERHARAISNLMNASNEERRIENEENDAEERLKEEKKKRWFSFIPGIIGIALNALFIFLGFRMEEKGEVFTSQTFKHARNGLNKK